MTTANIQIKAEAPGVRYILDNSAYPDYIRNHAVFSKQNKITKVFPSIGLPNISEECEYNNISDAKTDAGNLLYSEVRNAVYYALDTYGINVQLRTLLNALSEEIINNYTRMVIEEEGRIAIKFTRDTGSWDNKVFFKKGEGFFKAYNKLIEKCKEHCVTLSPLEGMTYFKNFSTNNIPPNKKFQIVFASTGAEGLWDIATISMRGINSCQTWGSSQSRGLIGSMSSKYVGVVYITSGTKFNEHGTKMMRRSLVRFCINKTTKKPGLLVDRVYPSDDASTRTIFRKFLEKKSGLPVVYAGEKEWVEYQLPTDSSWKIAPFQTNEYTYMDSKIAWIASAPTPKSSYPYYNELGALDREFQRTMHLKIVSMYSEYLHDKNTHKDIFKGGVANFISSLKKWFGNEYYVARVYPSMHHMVSSQGYTTIPLPDFNQYDSIVEYKKSFIKTILKHSKELEAPNLTRLRNLGKFTSHYPKSVIKFNQLFLNEYKTILKEEYKKTHQIDLIILDINVTVYLGGADV